VALGLGLLVAGFVAFIWYTYMDRKLEKSEGVTDEHSEEDEFKIRDILFIINNKGFWLIALLCVLFYSGVFPFLYYATDLMINKYGVNPDFAGAIPGLLPFGTIILTPFFGNFYDRKGKGATIMLIGSVMLLIAHSIFAIPVIDNYIVAIGLILFLGVTFSLVPSAMWPSVPKIIPEKQLGTAYALIFWVQNWGLMGVPLLIGVVLDKYCQVFDANGEFSHYDYTIPMMIFASTGLLAIIVAVMLKAEDKKKGYGLELPNIEK
ncbi:MAG: MFS transporter, partial [Bacteroidales bacterium]|nr:MFS transporter [Bacteroidales bacterium]